MDFMQNEKDNLQIDRFDYGALHDGKTDELQNEKTDGIKGILYCRSSTETPLLSDLEKFIDKKYEERL